MLTDNQNRKAIRDVIREAFDRLGGSDWLVTFATTSPENARVFVSLVGRLIPTELVGRGGGPLTIVIKKEGDPEIGRVFEQLEQLPQQLPSIN